MPCCRTPPQSPPNFDITPSAVRSETENILSTSRNLRDEIIASVGPSTATFSNVLQPLIDHENVSLCRLKILTLFATVSEDQEIRDASRAAEQLVVEADAEGLMDDGIARLVAAVFERWREGKEELDAQAVYFLKRKHREFVRNCLGVKDGEERERYVKLVMEVNSLLAAACKTLSEANDGIWFMKDELPGVPCAILESMKYGWGKNDWGADLLFCTFRKGHYVPVMRQCTRMDSRKRLYIAKENRFQVNVERLGRIVELRDEIARWLGFRNHAELKMEEKMSESVEDVETQLRELKERLQPIAKAEIKRMLKLKRSVLVSRESHEDIDSPDTLYFWDWSFYDQKLRKEEYAVNTGKISEYFEVTHTLKGMLSIFEELFGIHFKQTEASVWQKEVAVCTLWNSSSQGGQFIGYLYFDLFARKGKYEGAHHAMIEPGYTDGQGNRHHAADALICSFLKRAAGQPTLLEINEVRTMFHELGHCIHFLVSKARYALYPSRYFVEIPSIMLENWIWVPEVLKSLGRHYSYLSEDFHTFWKGIADGEGQERLPDKLIEDLMRTKNVNGAHGMLTQLHLAMFDLAIHTPQNHEASKGMDTTALWNGLKEDIIGLANDDTMVPGIGQAGFPHIYRKYDAGYFSYALSQLCAADLYSSAFMSDPLNPATGRRYRELVLEPGAGVSEAGTLRGFLGRNPSSEAYYAELARGIE